MKYSIEGAPLPVVICDLEAGESMITEKGDRKSTRLNSSHPSSSRMPSSA